MIRKCPFCQTTLSKNSKGLLAYINLVCRKKACRNFQCSIDTEVQEIVWYKAAIEIDYEKYFLTSASKLFYDYNLTNLLDWKDQEIINIKEFYPASSKEELINISTRLLKLVIFI